VRRSAGKPQVIVRGQKRRHLTQKHFTTNFSLMRWEACPCMLYNWILGR
jgi:hypothetical protein